MKILRMNLGMFFIFFTLLINCCHAMPSVANDGEIIAYMQSINNAEISASKVAQDKSVAENVMNFAKMMVQQHGDNLQQVEDLSKKFEISPEDTAGVKNFQEKNDKELNSLSSLTGMDFQKAYVKAMIKGHAEAEQMINRFIQQVKNASLKDYLITTKKAVEEHLAAAKKLK